jgi:uncharacterized membrane protein
MRPRLLMFTLAAAVLAPLSSAWADFKVCDKTDHPIGIAIGHNKGGTWVSEGWWNIKPHTCMTVLDGPLTARYYYVHAVDYGVGGGWVGDRYFCTAKKSFTISGRGECAARGFQRSGFFEVDTQNAANYTEDLTDPTQK